MEISDNFLRRFVKLDLFAKPDAELKMIHDRLGNHINSLQKTIEENDRDEFNRFHSLREPYHWYLEKLLLVAISKQNHLRDVLSSRGIKYPPP